jgi:hypothetical protein
VLFLELGFMDKIIALSDCCGYYQPTQLCGI